MSWRLIEMENVLEKVTNIMIKHILILGGTGEARKLAQRINSEIGKRVKITTSLAGIRSSPPNLPGEIRNGGFGGIQGMREYLSKEDVDIIIDATHPFSKIISNHATIASSSFKDGRIPRLQLIRPLWRIPTSALCIEVDNLEAAANYIKKAPQRVFLTTGIRGLNKFSNIKDLWFLVRLIDHPKIIIPLENFKLIIGRPPYTLENEQDILAQYSIDTLVAKHAGGSSTEAKILAAAESGVQIVLIRRPTPEPGPIAKSIDEALTWISERV